MRCHNFALYLAFWKNGLFFFKFCWSTKRSISHDHSAPDIFVYKVMILWCNWSIKIKLLDGNTVRQLCGEHARQTISWLYLKLLECNIKGISSDDMFITVIIHCQKKGQQIKRNVNQSATFFLCFKKLMFSKTALTLKSIFFWNTCDSSRKLLHLRQEPVSSWPSSVTHWLLLGISNFTRDVDFQIKQDLMTNDCN